MSRSASTPRHEFWLSHRRRAKAERMSLRAYAQREGLSLASIYAARPAAPRSSSVLSPVPTGFAAVRVSGAAADSGQIFPAAFADKNNRCDGAAGFSAANGRGCCQCMGRW